MSANTYPIFFNSAYLDSTNGTIYTAPASPSTITVQDLQLKITNTTTATHTVTIYVVASGGTATSALAVAVNMSVPPNDYILIPVPRFGAGATLQGFADTADALNVQAVGGKTHTP